LGLAGVWLILLGAAFDYFEDFGILNVLNETSARHVTDASAAAISQWAFMKWGFVFAATICLARFPVQRWPSSALLRFAGVAAGLWSALSGVSGTIAALIMQNPTRVEASANGIAALVLFYIPFFLICERGFVNGMDRLAGSIFLSWLANWTRYGKYPVSISLTQPPPRRRMNRLAQYERSLADQIAEGVSNEQAIPEQKSQLIQPRPGEDTPESGGPTGLNSETR
jgi:hypothetical protein